MVNTPKLSDGGLDRLAPLEMASDGSFVGQERQLRALNTRSKALTVSVVGLTLLSLAVLGVAIWAGVSAQHAKDDVRSLAANGVAGTGQSAAGSAAGDVYVSGSPVPPEGYLFAGSIFRGSGYWSNTSSNLPSPRADFAAVPLPNDKVLIVGGQDSSGAYLSSGVIYDAVLDWYDTSVAAMPTPRARFAAAAVGPDTVIVMGGFKDAASTAAGNAESCPLIYTVSSDSWTTGGPCMSAPVADACAAGIGGKFYIAGGAVQGRPSDAIFALDPVASTLAKVGTLPSPRSGVACAALGNTLYVAGGTGEKGQSLNELVSFSPNTGALQTLATLPFGSGDVELVALPSQRLLAIGGQASAASATQIPLHYVQEYSPAIDTWVQKAPIATSRLRAGAAAANGGVYAFGGLPVCTPSATGCSNWALADTEVFYDISRPEVFLHLPNPAASSIPQPPQSKVLLTTDSTPVNGFTNAGFLFAGSGYWAEEVDMPSPLSDFAAVSYGSLIFIPGGAMADTSTSADLLRFDTDTSTYAKLKPMPAPRMRYGAAILKDQLYVVGGLASNSSDAQPVKEMFIYDIPSDTWTVSNASLATPRSDACMAALDGKLYIAGGYNAGFTETLDTAEVYDPNTGSWTQVARPMPTPRGDVMCAAFDSKFVVVGGYYDPTGQWLPSSFRTEVETYDPQTEDWTALAPLPKARGDNALVQLPGNRMMVMGGETNTEARTQMATSQVDEYLAAYDMWVPQAPMPEPRMRFDTAFANGFVYVFGGQTSALCTPGPNGADDCKTRPRATATKLMDIDHPDVFINLAD